MQTKFIERTRRLDALRTVTVTVAPNAPDVVLTVSEMGVGQPVILDSADAEWLAAALTQAAAAEGTDEA